MDVYPNRFADDGNKVKALLASPDFLVQLKNWLEKLDENVTLAEGYHPEEHPVVLTRFFESKSLSVTETSGDFLRVKATNEYVEIPWNIMQFINALDVMKDINRTSVLNELNKHIA